MFLVDTGRWPVCSNSGALGCGKGVGVLWTVFDFLVDLSCLVENTQDPYSHLVVVGVPIGDLLQC